MGAGAGLSRITWTFDPLVRRNAHFNLVKLGARPEEYLPSFYGAVEDSINGGDETDRVLAVWPLNDARVVAAVEGRREAVPDGAVALGERDGRPVRGRVEERPCWWPFRRTCGSCGGGTAGSRGSGGSPSGTCWAG
ncbi:hypothetical protein [Actinomadura sp. J1-007]|uniref:hypothetical protein n=1 Tax=Actinomadura sp. J1-007 TaxID=2661913 RepID=UPI001F4FC826|nr:hypothetical protein [Actinomadura sp. J1-007]